MPTCCLRSHPRLSIERDFGAVWTPGDDAAGRSVDWNLYGQEHREGADPIRGTPRWVPLDRDVVGRAGAWLRVDGRSSRTWNPQPVVLTLFLDVQNLSVWAQPTGLSYSTAAMTGARTSRPASSPLGFPIPVPGLEARL
jgi:hypothetical protein